MQHPYTVSLLANTRWFAKRILYPSILDFKIKKFLEESLSNTKMCLNLGCGAWTPYDAIIKKKSKSQINIDATIIARIFHPFNGKKIIVDDVNLFSIIKKNYVTRIVSFHTLPFVHINHPRLIHYCYKNDIDYFADISMQKGVKNLSPYFSDEGQILLVDSLRKTNAIIYDVSSDDIFVRVSANDIRSTGRYLVKIENSL